MEALFLKILNMSLTASWLVFAVLLLRLLFKKAPKAFSVFLWAFVGIRLICPFSFESVLSLIPNAEPIPQEILFSTAPAVQSGVPLLNAVVNPILSESFAPEVGASINPMQTFAFVASVIWIIGIAVMILYSLLSYLSIHWKVREAIPYQDQIWLCDHIDTPFILGVIRPRIYLPSDLKEEDVTYVIAHEKAHLKRRDHWWKPLAFLLLTIYWFHPLFWVAYSLLCKDIELACDEKVLKEMGTTIKKSYSNALINCSVPRKMVSACPLAFGETGVKERVRSVLNYKKPALWIVVAAVILSILVALCFLTDPKPKTSLGTSSQTFQPVELLYDDSRYSMLQPAENAPAYRVSKDMQLFEIATDSEEKTLGTFEEIHLDDNHFDSRFQIGSWADQASLESLKKDNQRIWQLYCAPDKDVHHLYLLLEQTDGTVFLGIGYYNLDSEEQTNPDNSHIRWLYQLEERK